MNETTINNLNSWRNRLKLLHMVYIAVCALAIISVFISGIFTSVLLLLCLLFHVFYLRPQVKKYCKAFNHENLLASCEELLQGAQHNTSEGIDKSIVLKSGLMPIGKDKSYLSRELLTGRWCGFDVKLSDITVCHEFLRNDKNHYEFISGCWTHVELDSDTGCNYKILPKFFMTADGERLFFARQSVLTAKPFGKAPRDEKYSLYIADESPLPSSEVLNKLTELAEYSPGLVAMSVHGNNVDVMIKNRFLDRKVSMREVATAARLKAPVFPELKHVLQLARKVSAVQQ